MSVYIAVKIHITTYSEDGTEKIEADYEIRRRAEGWEIVPRKLPDQFLDGAMGIAMHLSQYYVVSDLPVEQVAREVTQVVH